MVLLVTSAAGADGDGYGKLLAFDRDGRPLGVFSDDSRSADPRGLAADRDSQLLFVNSGADRTLALGPDGRVIRDTSCANRAARVSVRTETSTALRRMTWSPSTSPQASAWG